jgi:hypothetical protein
MVPKRAPLRRAARLLDLCGELVAMPFRIEEHAAKADTLQWLRALTFEQMCPRAETLNGGSRGRVRLAHPPSREQAPPVSRNRKQVLSTLSDFLFGESDALCAS